MTNWLLDTNVLSELRRERPEQKVADFVSAQPARSLYISMVTISEIQFGIEVSFDAAQQKVLKVWLESIMRPAFDGRIFPISEEIMLRWRMLVQAARKARHTFTQPDLFLAATALHHGLTLVTRDTGDFRLTNVAIHNPWTDPLPA